MINRLILVLILMSFLGRMAVAAVPTTFNYQGFLKNGDGLPVNGAVAVTFSLYSSNPGRSNPVWHETQPAVTVANGFYNAKMGSITPLDAAFDTGYWLGIKIGTDAEMLPLEPLAAVPFAFKAYGLNAGATVTTSNPIISTVVTGTAPLQVASSSLITNLNAEMLAGKRLVDLDGRYIKAGPANSSTYDLVRDFGAVCDDNTDDTAALNAANTAMQAAGGGTLIITGMCKITSPVIVMPYVNEVGTNPARPDVAPIRYTSPSPASSTWLTDNPLNIKNGLHFMTTADSGMANITTYGKGTLAIDNIVLMSGPNNTGPLIKTTFTK